MTTDCDESLLLQRKPDGTIQYRAVNSVDPVGINGQSVYNGTPGGDRVFGCKDNENWKKLDSERKELKDAGIRVDTPAVEAGMKIDERIKKLNDDKDGWRWKWTPPAAACRIRFLRTAKALGASG